MKVTVCFGSVRVVVPCGEGDILVKDLIREATLRYKKATGKGAESWVSVHNLQSQGGGILDPDDRLSDVADDREQILASFEDGDGAHHHGGGDGASGSSVGTGSPDIFHDGDKYGSAYSRTDIEVTGEQIASGVPGALQVRRGSEPALNQLPVGPPAPSEHTKRWSAAPLILEPPSSGYVSPEWEDTREEDEDTGFKRVGKDGSNRLSMQFLGDGAGYRWVEAAERASSNRVQSTSLPREARRKEPLGQANNPSPVPNNYELIVIRNEPGPLGIHVVPEYDKMGKDKGLLVQGIEPGGRIDRDGRLAIYDRIIEINGHNLINMPFQRVQEMFKLSLTSPELRLKVVKASGLESLRRPPAPVYPNGNDKENISMVEGEQKQGNGAKVATVSPTKKIPAISKNLKGLLTANTRKIGRKYEIELTKGANGLGFSITTRDNPAGGNCPIYIKNILPKGAAVEDGRLKIGDRLLEVNNVEMTGKSQAEAVAVLRNAPTGSKVRIVVSRQEDVPENTLPRVIDLHPIDGTDKDEEVPPNIPPLPQSHLQSLQNRSPDKNSVAKIISQFQDSLNSSNPPDKLDESMVFPWKHKEILTFNIPVHDSEKAGLGISVKGKTSGSQDLGIFIKSVINGGAASRDKRLRTNDQLLNVNGISLLQQSNSDAMETLRKAMLHTEGPVPRNITLTIARKASSPGPNRSFNKSEGSLSQSKEGDPSLTDHSGASSGSTNTVIYNPNCNNSNSNGNVNLSPIHTWNPVLERLTGNAKQLRNESYYKAAHDSWNASNLVNTSYGNMSTTVNVAPTEPILIEDEYGSRVLTHQNSQINVHMSNKMNLSNGSIPENRNDHEPDGKASCDKSTDNSSQNTVPATDATYASQLSLENPQGFSRDAFGRQSMSEKRHATLDAKHTDTYQRSKKLREERIKNKETNLVRVGSVESVISVNRSQEHPEYADKLGQLGPSLGMKKSSSLESLQTMVQEIQMQEEGDPAYSYRGPGGLKVIRGRGCEESFRAAVVDPNHRSEISAKKHWLTDGPIDSDHMDGFSNVRGGPRQSSLNAALDKKGKKKAGLFKGIGSMFRFGKHRKVEFVNQDQYHSGEFDSIPVAPPEQKEEEAGNNNNERVQEQQIQQQQSSSVNKPQGNSPQYQYQQQQQIQREPIYQRHPFVHRHAEQIQVIPENMATNPVKYRNDHRRTERKMHDQRQRHTFYQQNEEGYDYRQQRIDGYGEYGRPGSRTGITESVPFTHYVNYNELQNHLSRKETLSDSQIVQMRLQVQQQRLKVEEESRKQHQYHSQRQTRNDNQLRPVSNYYEYESVQSVLQMRGARQNLPMQHATPAQIYQQDVNSNSLPRQQQQQIQSRHPNGRNARGPFVTHVTIGEHANQKNGTKV